MSRKSIASLALSASLALACPALAQEAFANARTVAEQQPPGIRVDAASGGFQLVTLGIWAQPAVASAEVPSVSSPARPTAAAPRRQRDTKRKSTFRRTIYLPHVYAAEAQFGIPSGLLDALIWTESRYNPLAVSGAGAVGLGQLMPGTARELGVFNRFDPRASLTGAARYLKQMLDKFGMVHIAVAAYNAGPGAVERAGGIPLNGETPTYVRNVLEFWEAK